MSQLSERVRRSSEPATGMKLISEVVQGSSSGSDVDSYPLTGSEAEMISESATVLLSMLITFDDRMTVVHALTARYSTIDNGSRSFG